MPFKDNLSKLAKTVGEGATAVAKKSGDMVEVTKLNLAIQSEVDGIKSMYSDIGAMIYKKYEDGEQLDEDIITICEKIKDKEDIVTELKQKVLYIKNIKMCANCKTELSPEIIFCPKCGKEL
jgi:hypothetical protein